LYLFFERKFVLFDNKALLQHIFSFFCLYFV